ncbi:MAG TPA: hypothetical protein VKA46_18750 [Gemmataceae bacterium]|nr:hypothetical protein [Gemmataceae bacterium]
MTTVPTILPEPILVANLPLPPEDAALLERSWRSRRYTRSEREFLEDDVKLSHHYAGHYVIATAGPHRLQIHAIDLEDPDQIHELTQRLSTEGHRHVLHLFPTPWKSTTSQIGIIYAES